MQRLVDQFKGQLNLGNAAPSNVAAPAGITWTNMDVGNGAGGPGKDNKPPGPGAGSSGDGSKDRDTNDRNSAPTFGGVEKEFGSDDSVADSSVAIPHSTSTDLTRRRELISLTPRPIPDARRSKVYQRDTRRQIASGSGFLEACYDWLREAGDRDVKVEDLEERLPCPIYDSTILESIKAEIPRGHPLQVDIRVWYEKCVLQRKILIGRQIWKIVCDHSITPGEEHRRLEYNGLIICRTIRNVLRDFNHRWDIIPSF